MAGSSKKAKIRDTLAVQKIVEVADRAKAWGSPHTSKIVEARLRKKVNVWDEQRLIVVSVRFHQPNCHFDRGTGEHIVEVSIHQMDMSVTTLSASQNSLTGDESDGSSSRESKSSQGASRSNKGKGKKDAEITVFVEKVIIWVKPVFPENLNIHNVVGTPFNAASQITKEKADACKVEVGTSEAKASAEHMKKIGHTEVTHGFLHTQVDPNKEQVEMKWQVNSLLYNEFSSPLISNSPRAKCKEPEQSPQLQPTQQTQQGGSMISPFLVKCGQKFSKKVEYVGGKISQTASEMPGVQNIEHVGQMVHESLRKFGEAISTKVDDTKKEIQRTAELARLERKNDRHVLPISPENEQISPDYFKGNPVKGQWYVKNTRGGKPDKDDLQFEVQLVVRLAVWKNSTRAKTTWDGNVTLKANLSHAGVQVISCAPFLGKNSL